MSALLTADEREAMRLTAELANTLGRVVGDGRTRLDDLRELVAPIHVIQHAIMSQAAARAFPTEFRLLGGIIEESP